MGDTTFSVLDASSSTVTFRSQAVVGTTQVMMSIPSNAQGTVLANDPNWGLGIFPPITTKVSVGFTRPADATTYSPGDAIANTTTAGGVTALQWAIATAGNIRRIMQTKSFTTNTQTINVWLFDSNPGTAAVDNAAFSTQIVNSLGFIAVGVTATGSDVAAGWSNCDIPVRAGTVYGLLQANGTLTTVASENYTTVLWYLPG